MTSLLLLAASQDLARVQSWNPDPSVVIDLPSSGRFVRDIPFARQLSIPAAFTISDQPGSHLIVTFVSRAPDTSLRSHIRKAHAVLLEAVPNKTVVTMESNRLRRLFSANQFSFAAFSYPSKPRENGEGSICDAVAVFWETRGGIWTVSVNGNMGTGEAIQSTLEQFMTEMKISRMNSPARVPQD